MDQTTTGNRLFARRFDEHRWARAYQRVGDVAFATVPYYRELWSLSGLGQPSTVDEITRRAADLVPLRGGVERSLCWRGVRASVGLTQAGPGPGRIVVVPDCQPDWCGAAGEDHRPANGPQPPQDVSVVPGADLAGAVGLPASAVLVTDATCEPARVAGRSGSETRVVLRCDPRRPLPHPAEDVGRVLYLPWLGYVGGLAHCGHWHLDWREVYARRTGHGVVCLTLLRQRSPRLVDIALDAGIGLARCPHHRTPVLTG